MNKYTSIIEIIRNYKNTIFLIIILIITIFYYNLCQHKNYYRFKLITENNKYYNDKLKKFEHELSNYYPLGRDHFRIDHGLNYFSFFTRLGSVNYIMALNKGEIIASCCAILRQINGEKIWYLCDLKVHPNYRGNKMSIRMLLKYVYKLKHSRKVYGISMNNSKKNRMLNLANKNSLLKFKSDLILMIYSLNYDQMLKALPLIKFYLYPRASFISLRGKKDLILKSTQKPMRLLHLHNKNIGINPQKGYTHMFCCLKNSKLYNELNKINITTNISANIIHHGMDNYDWRFIETSDI